MQNTHIDWPLQLLHDPKGKKLREIKSALTRIVIENSKGTYIRKGTLSPMIECLPTEKWGKRIRGEVYTQLKSQLTCWRRTMRMRRSDQKERLRSIDKATYRLGTESYKGMR
jgi:hypothetical protein